MTSKRKIRRYAPYFQGWATAFGNHDKRFDEARNLSWLFGENQIGLILTPDIKAFLDPLLSANDQAPLPRISLGVESLRVADAALRLCAQDQQVVDATMRLLKGSGDLYLLQTYHLVYATGTRILTLTRQPPLALVYREIQPLFLHFA